MHRNASFDLIAARRDALVRADRELQDATEAALPPSAGRDYLLALIRTPNATRRTLEPATAPATAASRWLRAGMPSIHDVRRRMNAHRVVRLRLAGASIGAAAVELGMAAPHLRRHLGPIADAPLGTRLSRLTPDATLTAWSALLLEHRDAVLRYRAGPAAPRMSRDFALLVRREKTLERELARVRAELRAQTHPSHHKAA